MTAPTRANPEALTEQHRLAQLDIRTHALRDFLVLWPLWNGGGKIFSNLVTATMPLVNVYRDASATLARTYLDAVRAAQGVADTAAPTVLPPIAPQQVASSLYVTGEVMTREALNAGMNADQARSAALSRVSGAVSRHVLNAGRETVIASVAADPHALGWARVTDGEPCAFCAMLAARGAVYKSEHTADFHAHDHCGCSIMPVYRDSKLPPTSLRWRQIYNRSQREAQASGELDRGTANDRLNAFRRALAADLGQP